MAFCWDCIQHFVSIDLSLNYNEISFSYAWFSFCLYSSMGTPSQTHLLVLPPASEKYEGVPVLSLWPSSHQGSSYTGVPHFLKVYFLTLLLQKTYNSTCFCNWKKCKEVLTLMKKGRTQNSSPMLVLQQTSKGAECTWCSEHALTTLLFQEPHSVSASRPLALNCVCEHLCFILNNSVHLFTGCLRKA